MRLKRKIIQNSPELGIFSFESASRLEYQAGAKLAKVRGGSQCLSRQIDIAAMLCIGLSQLVTHAACFLKSTPNFEERIYRVPHRRHNTIESLVASSELA